MDRSHNAEQHVDGRNAVNGREDTNRRGSEEITAVGENIGVSAEREDEENGATEGYLDRPLLAMRTEGGPGGQAPWSDSREEGVVRWTSRDVPMRLEDAAKSNGRSSCGITESSPRLREKPK